MRKLGAILNTPMHDTCSMRESLRTMSLIGLFVTLFLWIFEPFGFDSIPGNSFPYALGFGGITLATGLIHEFIELKIMRFRKDLPSWTFWKWLISMLILIMMIAAGNMLFASWLSGWHEFDLDDYLRTLGNTAAIGFFPVTLFGIMNIRRNEKRFSHIASGLPAPVHQPADHHQITLPSNAGDDVETEVGSILFIEASQNYLTIHRRENDHYSSQMIRNTLKDIRSVLSPYERIIQCHRSFLVNMDHIEEVSGNSQGLILHLDPEKTLNVPVSRTYIPAVRHRMQPVS